MPVLKNTDIPLPTKSTYQRIVVILLIASLYLVVYARSTKWNTVWLMVFALSFLFTAAATALLYRYAKARQIMPEIRERDVHTKKKPRIGGLAMWAGIMATFFWIFRSNNYLQFGGDQHFGVDNAMWGIIIGMAILLIVGLIDDIKGLSWPYQLLGQYAATLALVLAGITVSSIQLPFDQVLHLNTFWGGIFTTIWVMVIINVMNWFDGLDGLAGSVGLTAALALFFVSLKVDFYPTAVLSLVIAGAAGGFLPWNWHPSKIFMGTVGSQMLGFLLGVTAIISGGKVATTILVLGIPILDAVIVIARRMRAGQSIFSADQRHLHHRLLKIGLPVPWIVILVNAIAVVFAILAVRSQGANTKGLLTLALIVAMALFIIATYVLERRADQGVQ